MRLSVVFACLACSCATPASARPAWPKPAAREVDGGESLAPRAAARTIAAVAEEDRPPDRAVDKPAAPAAATPAAAPSTTTPAAPGTPAADEPINAEDIVIEIED